MVEKKELVNLFFREKPVHLFAAMSAGGDVPKYVSVLAKRTDCTYSHTVKLLNHFERLGFVEFQKRGRVKYVKLTEDGKKLASALDSIMRILSKKSKEQK